MTTSPMIQQLKKIIFAIALLSGSAAYAQSSGYHIINTYHISSPGRWDYVALNPLNENLYVSHTTQVNILNRNTGDSTGVIENTTGVHGIAFAPAFKKGFTSNGRINTVTVFDINTNQVLAQIKTGENPDAIMYDPFSKKVFVCNGHSKDISVIDPGNNEVVKTVAVGGAPETAVSDEAGKIYVDIEDKDEVVVLDTKTYTVERHWKTGKGKEPAGLAIDKATRRLFVGCGNRLLVVLNAENGKVIKELPIGDGCDGTAFDPATKLIFCSNGEGTLSVFKENSANDISLVENVVTKKGARTLAVDTKTHRIFLLTADFEQPKTNEPPTRRPNIIPGSFQVLVVGK